LFHAKTHYRLFVLERTRTRIRLSPQTFIFPVKLSDQENCSGINPDGEVQKSPGDVFGLYNGIPESSAFSGWIFEAIVKALTASPYRSNSHRGL
jgi:hypothetical protein